MNTYKNIFCACNGTRIAQSSLLIALAFLCLAIVSMCVFYNLNALATDNIAYAEEEEITRGISDNGYFFNNLIPNNYCLDWNYVATSTDSAYTYFYEDDVVKFGIKGYSINNNVLTKSAQFSYFRIDFKQPQNIPTGSLRFAVGVPARSYTQSCFFTGVFSSSNTNSASYSTFGYSPNSFTNGSIMNSDAICYIEWYTTSGSIGNFFRLSFLSLTNSNTFDGYVSPDYQYYGYNQGYQDGLNAGGGSGTPDPDYSTISSTGIVRDNLVDNNDWTNASYNISVSAGSTIFFDGINFDNELICEGGTASIIGNTFSNDGHSCQLDFNVKDFDTPLISSSIYIFTIYLSHFNNRADLYLTCYCDSFTNYIEIPHTSSDGFYSLLIDLSEYSNISFNDFYIELEMRAGGSVDISWFKLEEGSSFSGYVPKSYKMYGYNDGYNASYDIGKSDGYDLGYQAASMQAFNYIGDIENMPLFNQQYFDLGSIHLVSYSSEEDSFSHDGVTYKYSYFDTQGDDSGNVYNGLVLDYKFKYSIRIITQFYGSSSRWNQVGFKFLIIDSDNHNSYYFVSREDTNYITYLSTWTNVGNAFGDVYNVQVDIPLPDNNKFYYLAIVPINWNYHDINAQSRDLRAGESYQDTSTFLLWENTKVYGLTTQSNYIDIVNDRVNEAWSDGHFQGVQEGRSQGEQTGYTIGYNEGVNAAGNYTFYSLLGAVFDTPISTLRGLLNFNILGVNLYDFVIALLSLAIVLFVFRIFVRGL